MKWTEDGKNYSLDAQNNKRGYFMEILIVRHCEPDYSIDSLTPKGWREAEILSDRLSKMDIT